MSKFLDTAKYVSSINSTDIKYFPVIQRHNTLMILSEMRYKVENLQENDIIGTTFLIRSNQNILAISAAHVIFNKETTYLGFPDITDPQKIVPLKIKKEQWHIPICKESTKDSNYCLEHDFSYCDVTQLIVNNRSKIELGYFDSHEYSGTIDGPMNCQLMIYGFPHGNTFIAKNGLKTAYSERIPGRIETETTNTKGIRIYKSAISNGVSGGPVLIRMNGHPMVIGIIKSSGYKNRIHEETGKITDTIIDEEKGTAVKIENLLKFI